MMSHMSYIMSHMSYILIRNLPDTIMYTRCGMHIPPRIQRESDIREDTVSHMSYIMSHMSYIGISDSGPHGTIDALP